ncbi:ANK3 [Symbiodinium pilosum]|uniref:ANK3 protein n=1 Tax=Symbiodinium pilosum TaxID=2952 RepID=A0A812L1M4_SYMPI|nr:ANK3 [Symbiodinium pilosum]
MEHADGSFLDHLQFCYEYCAAHFEGHSPRVLFLHSIMGVGTNYFPMKLDLVPKLQTLVSDEEFKHIEAFPSILRLMLHFDFIQELESQGPVRLASAFDGVSFRRVIDNKQLGKQSLSMYFVLPWLASSDASAFARAVNLAG